MRTKVVAIALQHHLWQELEQPHRLGATGMLGIRSRSQHLLLNLIQDRLLCGFLPLLAILDALFVVASRPEGFQQDI